MTRPLRVFVIAGEASGDLLGGSLMQALKSRHPDISFYGIGGEKMQAEGLQSLFPMHELSVMGISEILPKLFSILGRIRQTVAEIIKTKPDAVVTIDSPDFCFRVIKKLKKKAKDIPCIHYVAPSVWAWRPGRAEKISRFLDHLLTLLPFEPPYFEKYGLKTTFVGHPVVERIERRGDGARFRSKHGLKPEQPVICLLPGSRVGEVQRLLNYFNAAINSVLKQKHDAVIFIPTLPHLKEMISGFFKGKGINPIITTSMEEKFDAFAAGTVAVAASGTVSLELALCDTPHLISYRMSPISTLIAKRFVKTPYVNLVNILLKRETVPELLFEDCCDKKISAAMLKLMNDREARAAQLTDFRQALIMLGLGDTQAPGQKAAEAVLDVISSCNRSE